MAPRRRWGSRSPTMLVTLREQRIGSLEALTAGLEHEPCHSADDLLLRMFDHLVGRLADRLEALEAAVTETTRQVFDSPHKTKDLERMLHQVGDMGRQLGGLHNAGQGMQRLVTYLDGAAPDWFAADAAKRITLLHKDLTTLSEFQQHMDDRIEFLLDSVLGMINMDQNNVMKVMAVASVVGIPPTVLVGIWGMNFLHARTQGARPLLLGTGHHRTERGGAAGVVSQAWMGVMHQCPELECS